MLFAFVFYTPKTYAYSIYVLPYPSAMPGNIFYKLELIKEYISRFWYFGDFGQFDFNLKKADKYLVEAKTLFEYKQYLLGYKALLVSDTYFEKTKPTLLSAAHHGKNISDKSEILKGASRKHIEVLLKMNNEVPNSFTWTPEKDKPTNLNLEDAISKSIKIRKSVLN